MESVGERIKKLRLEKGLTLEEAHKRTKIHLNILKAIEEDNLINLNPVYIRGFLKIYCKFLGVDPNEYIADNKDEEAAESQAAVTLYGPDTKEDSSPVFKKSAPKLPALKFPLKPIIAVIVLALFIGFLFQLGKFISYRFSQFSKRARPAIVAKALPSKPQKSRGQAVMSAVKQSQQIVSKNSGSGIRLSILTKEDCWINLKNDGKLIFHGILKKGRTESWQAKERIELSLSNAGVVNLEVNGKLITNLGRRGQSLKNIIITKEGLNIGQ